MKHKATVHGQVALDTATRYLLAPGNPTQQLPDVLLPVRLSD